MRVLKIALIAACLATPAMAEQVARVMPSNFTVQADPTRGVCVASDYVLSARKAGMTVAFVLDGAGRSELVIAPVVAPGKALLPQILDFTFEDSMTVRSSAKLRNGRYLVDLQKGDKATPLWIALRRHDHTVVSLPLRPADRVGLDLSKMPAVFTKLQDCVKGLGQ